MVTARVQARGWQRAKTTTRGGHFSFCWYPIHAGFKRLCDPRQRTKPSYQAVSHHLKTRIVHSYSGFFVVSRHGHQLLRQHSIFTVLLRLYTANTENPDTVKAVIRRTNTFIRQVKHTGKATGLDAGSTSKAQVSRVPSGLCPHSKAEPHEDSLG